MATLPPGQLTFGQIRDLALRRLGNPAQVADAGTVLSQILFELYVSWEWPFLNTAINITLTGPLFTLPIDFLKTQHDRGLLLIQIDGAQAFGQVVNETDPFTFESVAGGTGNTASLSSSFGVPQVWTVNRAVGVGKLFPDPTGHTIIANLRYKQLPVGDVTPPDPNNPLSKDATVPVFPYHLYLVQSLFCEMLKFENDPRQTVQESLRDKQLTLLQQGAHPIYSQVPVIPLDDDIFGPTFSSDGGGEGF